MYTVDRCNVKKKKRFTAKDDAKRQKQLSHSSDDVSSILELLQKGWRHTGTLGDGC